MHHNVDFSLKRENNKKNICIHMMSELFVWLHLLDILFA